MLAERVLPLSGIHNFRDYGGYDVEGGGKLRSGTLWRSAHHVEASDDDLAVVDGLGIETVIDLRGDDEREVHPCRRSDNFSARVLFAGGVTAGLAPHLQAAGGAIDVATARERMIDTYAGMPYRPALVATLRLYLSALAEYDAPSLVHCVAGKDRTGFAVAVVHRLLGVHEDDLMQDYLLTNSAGKIDERIAQGAAHIRARYGAEIQEDAIRALMSVNPAFLDAALATVRRDHGDVATYAEAVLNLTPEMHEAMVDRLVV
ncbi:MULTISPECIES: tyrosine-protein phosphatase [unclassified Sphingopyxis]|uniref:tyrosine-protein phosphatase n=1 Tax=unclassified Sphingopyxis TaxID=2614943 RepID=UPI000736E99C|nr:MULTISPECIES: tyrosine-protein phosphatase [unclassified Sphingopyxis]KTE44978.1 protein tyrosine phosphatase [Sphingopyxis sp. HIX]KTE84686.1 protein tyrosine phosphatase [Sphingopyxis sp. HXXIV]